ATAAAEGVLGRHEAQLGGREQELATLVEATDAAFRERRCGMVTLVGDAGLGKSRLGEELLRHVAGCATTLRGRCLPYGEGITFSPIVETVREAAGIADRDDAATAPAKLSALA